MKKIWAPQVIISLMLLWAIAPCNPYGYYVLVRILGCSIFCWLGFRAWKQKKQNWTWIYGVIAFINNPIYHFQLTDDLWAVINILTIIIAIISIFILTPQNTMTKK
jgi:hypothetical protein